MDQEQFTAYIKKLEGRWRRRPGLFRAWVVLLVASGYLYLLMLLLMALALIPVGAFTSIFGGFFGMVLLLIGVLVLVFWVRIMIRIATVKFMQPEGFVLTRRDAPVLFDRIGELSKRFRTPKIHTVILNHEFNCSISQTPRLGIFGMYRNSLVIGLPYLVMLNQGQFDAILAHELAHISKAHGRVACWIHRIREPWVRSMDTKLFRGFIAMTWMETFYIRFINKLNAADFVLRRADEYVADRMAAEAAGARQFAESLALTGIIPSHIQHGFMEEYHARSFREGNTVPLAEYLKDAVRAEISEDVIRKRYSVLLSHKTGYGDSHPCFRDRLEALGQPLEPPALPYESALEAYVPGGGEGSFLDRYHAHWLEQTKRQWAWRRRHECKHLEERHALLERQRLQALSANELGELARCTRFLYGMGEAQETYQQLLAADPYHPSANFHLGMLDLRQMRLEGVERIRQAINRDIEYYPPGYQAAYDCYVGNGMAAEAERFQKAQTKNAERYAEYHSYAYDMTYDTGISDLDVDREIAEMIRGGLRSAGKARRAYLSRKKKQGDKEVYVLLLDTRGLDIDEDDDLAGLVDDIRFRMEGLSKGIVIYSTKGVDRKYLRGFIKMQSVRVK